MTFEVQSCICGHAYEAVWTPIACIGEVSHVVSHPKGLNFNVAQHLLMTADSHKLKQSKYQPAKLWSTWHNMAVTLCFRRQLWPQWNAVLPSLN